jgi:hypothetical protein
MLGATLNVCFADGWFLLLKLAAGITYKSLLRRQFGLPAKERETKIKNDFKKSHGRKSCLH